MISIVRSLALALVLAGAAASGAQAQAASNTAGFNLGVFLNGSALAVDDADEVESGPGGSLHIGYGFTPALSIFTRINAASIEPANGADGDSYALAHVDLGARFTFGSDASAVRPFAQASLTGRAASFDFGGGDTMDLRGQAVTAGVGLGYFVSPTLAIEAGFSYSIGKFSEGRLDDDDWVELDDEAIEANSGRFDLGVSWHP